MISAGNYSVGSGGDYSTWAAAIADCTTQTADITLTQISHVTETAAFGATLRLNGFNLILTSNNRPQGVFSQGWLTTWNINVSSGAIWGLYTYSLVAGSILKISNLNFIATGTITTFGKGFDHGSIAQLRVDTEISNCLFDGNNKLLRAIDYWYADGEFRIYNCIAKACNVGFYLSNYRTTSKIENCTAYGNTWGFYNLYNIVYNISNCASLGSTNDYRFQASLGLGNAVASKCASSDTTGSEASLQSLVAAGEFRNLNPLTLGFLQLKPTSILNFMGVAPTLAGNTTGIRGNARPLQANVYSIGADEQGSAVTALKYTVGTGGDYSTWAAFAAALPASFVCDITGEQISDITDSTVVSIDKALNGCTLTLTNRFPHSGSFIRGTKTISTATPAAGNGGLIITCSSTNAGAEVVIKDIHFRFSGAVSGSHACSVYYLTGTTNVTNRIENCIFKSTIVAVHGITVQNTLCVLRTSNCVFADGQAGSAYSFGMYIVTINALSIIENCTAYNYTGAGYAGGLLNYPNTAIIVRNFASLGNKVDYMANGFVAGLGNTLTYKCASSDTTGSEAGLRSLVAANQFVSLDATSPDFLKLKAGSALLNSGVDPVIPYNINGIRGNAHLHGACYSIGADAWTDNNAGVYTVGTGGDYSTWNAFLSAMGTLSKNVKGVQISDIALVTAASYVGAKVGYNIELTSNINPRGNFNDGWYTDIAVIGTVHGISLAGSSGVAFSKNIVTNLKLRRTVGYAAGANVYAVLVFTSPLSNNINIAKDVLVDGNNLRGSGIGVSGAVSYFSNCKVANIDKTTSNNGYGLSVNVITGNGSTIENCTAYSCRVGFWNYSNIAAVYRNNAGFNCLLDYANGVGQSAGAGSTTVASKCASSDANGSEASLRSLVASDLFKSLDITSPNFLRLKKTGVLASGGDRSALTTVANYPPSLLNTRGINGSRRPHMV